MSNSHKMKHICLHIKNIANKGGEERMCVTLANGLAEQGHDVIIVSTKTPYSEKPYFELSQQIKLYRLLGNKIERNLWRLPFGAKYPIWKLRAILKKHHVDVVIDVDIRQSLITSLAINSMNTKIISWDHFDYEAFTTRRRKQLLIDCFKDHVDKLVVLTNRNRELFVKKEGLPESLVINIPNPSPLFNEQPWSEHCSKKILSIGRLEAQKGFDLLLEAWRVVEKEKLDWSLEIVGDGSYKQQYEAMISEMGLKNVHLTPFSNLIKDKYREASIYVLPSRTEGFGLVLVEAETMGLPLIAFDCGGPREIVEDGRNGYLVEPENYIALAEKMLKLMQDDELRKQMSISAYEDAKKFQKGVIMNQWIELLESL